MSIVIYVMSSDTFESKYHGERNIFARSAWHAYEGFDNICCVINFDYFFLIQIFDGRVASAHAVGLILGTFSFNIM
jgi:hypothetical protein